MLDEATLEAPLLTPFWELLSSSDFQAAVRALGGYDTTEMGRRVL